MAVVLMPKAALEGMHSARERFPGTAHAQENMMFRGRAGLSTDQLAVITAATGGVFDAVTPITK